MRPQERVANLKQIAHPGGLSEDAIARLAQSCKWRDYGAGEQIVGYADVSTDVLFLLTGKARVIIYSAEGKAVVFVDLVPATMFGEIASHRPQAALGERGGAGGLHSWPHCQPRNSRSLCCASRTWRWQLCAK